MESSNSPIASDPSPDADPATERYKETVNRFVDLWGEMASSWGINRTMAQIHALLYCVEQPLNTDEIMEQLDVSRGNANMNLRSLVDWNLVKKTQMPGSRKDYYVAEKDVWKITAQIIDKRKRREVQPVKEHLQACADQLVLENEELASRPDVEQTLHRRLKNLITLMEVFEGVSQALLPLVEDQNEVLLQRLIAFAKSLHQDAPSSSDTTANEG